MAHIQVEASVRTHKKFLKAGPAASWLWLCGVGYCQDGLTDGFIPFEALPYLGVSAPKNLKCRLVAVGLWDEVEGGWRIHDYEQHNRTAAEIALLKHDRRASGAAGGRASGLARRRSDTKQVLQPIVQPTVEAPREGSRNFAEAPLEPISSHIHLISDQIISSTSQKKEAGTGPPFDQWFLKLKSLYPSHRVTGGPITEQAFFEAIDRAGGDPEATFGRMLSNLSTQIRGEQWQDQAMVPKLVNWLNSGTWEQVHKPAERQPRAGIVFEAWSKCSSHTPPCTSEAQCRERNMTALRARQAAKA